MPPLATPFVSGELAVNKLEQNISKYNKTGLSGYVVMGSNGESVFLTREEKLNLIDPSGKPTLIIALLSKQ